MTFKGQGHRSNNNGTIRFHDLKNIDLDTKIAILGDFVQKFWSKTYLHKMVYNVMRSHMSHIQITTDIFDLLKGFYSS